MEQKFFFLSFCANTYTSFRNLESECFSVTVVRQYDMVQKTLDWY